MLEKTKGLLRGKKGSQTTNSEKLEARQETNTNEFHYTVGEIIARVEVTNPFINKLAKDLNDFILRVLDIKNKVRDELNLSEVQDVAFERALIYTLENLKTADIEEFEFNFKNYLIKNIEYWSKRTGKGTAKPRKIVATQKSFDELETEDY